VGADEGSWGGPHRPAPAHPRQPLQDGRKLRRYRRRWIAERTNAWLFNFRRLVVRYERKLENFRAFLHLACALIALRKMA
jgi:transposase